MDGAGIAPGPFFLREDAMKRECGLAVGVFLAILALYVGAYYATVDRVGMLTRDSFSSPKIVTGIVTGPTYRFAGDSLFLPMHFLDKHLRYDYWGGDTGIVVISREVE
jgi:hypothetical protein